MNYSKHATKYLTPFSIAFHNSTGTLLTFSLEVRWSRWAFLVTASSDAFYPSCLWQNNIILFCISIFSLEERTQRKYSGSVL